MGLALYRKYRSRSFREVIGQDPITMTLQRAIKSGHISHAYLFTGPRGVGKTTVARILAHEVNNLPYSDESMHLDIIEIDGASNRRIDEIRDLRDKVRITPTVAKYKVYIIDEVHMLTREAFNALLKTLEEPPAHCIFILATTEVHKLPETIISRTQHFNFKPIETSKAAEHLGVLAKKEKIPIDPEALNLLAEHGAGSFRDSINMLDQLSSTGQQITEEVVSELIGSPPSSLILDLTQSIRIGQPKKVLEVLTELRDRGAAPSTIARRLSKDLRQEILNNNPEDSTWITTLLKNLLEVSASRQPQEILEISILQSASDHRKPADKVESLSESQSLAPPIPGPIPSNSPQSPQPIKKQTLSKSTFSLDMWPLVLRDVKHKSGSLHSALRLASPKLEGDKLRLDFQFGLHQIKAGESKNIQLLEMLIKELTGAEVIVKCVLDKSIAKPESNTVMPTKNIPSELQTEDLQIISSIFGKSEVLES